MHMTVYVVVAAHKGVIEAALVASTEEKAREYEDRLRRQYQP